MRTIQSKVGTFAHVHANNARALSMQLTIMQLLLLLLFERDVRARVSPARRFRSASGRSRDESSRVEGCFECPQEQRLLLQLLRSCCCGGCCRKSAERPSRSAFNALRLFR